MIELEAALALVETSSACNGRGLIYVKLGLLLYNNPNFNKTPKKLIEEFE